MSDNAFAYLVVGVLVFWIAGIAAVMSTKPNCAPGETAIFSNSIWSYGWFCARAAR